MMDFIGEKDGESEVDSAFNQPLQTGSVSPHTQTSGPNKVDNKVINDFAGIDNMG